MTTRCRPELSFHHVGIAVHSMQKALHTYSDIMGFKVVEGPTQVPVQNVVICFVQAPPGVLLELIEGLSDTSPVKGFLEKNNPGPYHLCYRTPDLSEAIAYFREQKCIVLRRFTHEGMGLHRFAFLYSPDHQLFELCE